MKSRVIMGIMLTTILIGVLMLAFNFKLVNADPQPTISVVPPTITVPLYQSFSVNVTIENVENLFGWQARLWWDPLLLDVVSVTSGDFLNITGREVDFGTITNQSEGWIYVYSMLSMLYWPGPGVNGSGTLARVTFNSTGFGESVLNLNETRLFDPFPVWVTTPPYLGDANGDLEVNTGDASIIIEAFGSSVGDPNYNPNADFDSDGFVDLFDLLCVSFNLWREYPGDALQPVEIISEVQNGYVINVPVYDVAVTNVVPSQTVVGQGYSLNINVTAVNQGSYTETFNVTVYTNSTSIASQTVTITRGNSTTITFTWNTTGVPYGDYTINATATTLPGETDTTDNTFIDGTVIVAILADVNGDGVVDIFDALVISYAFWSRPGYPRWVPEADLNQDGIINSGDASILITNFGETRPPTSNP